MHLEQSSKHRDDGAREEREQPSGCLANRRWGRSVDGTGEVRRCRASPQLNVAEVGVGCFRGCPGVVVSTEEGAGSCQPRSPRTLSPRYSREVQSTDIDIVVFTKLEPLLVDGLDVVVANMHPVNQYRAGNLNRGLTRGRSGRWIHPAGRSSVQAL